MLCTHHIDGDGNFGVTTGLWDRLFDTATTKQKARVQ
jgi:sterol desaturase/sphingolipid hydroxylase (fatty acid hydroxylase superfamily)